MTEAAVRSQLLELRRALARATHGQALLDHKREVILRALTRETAARDRELAAWRQAAAIAAARLIDAEVESGVLAVESAALSQRPFDGLECRADRVAGVATLRLIAAVPPFRARYGLDGSAASLDEAGAAHAAALAVVVRLAQQELTVRRLRQALTETTRRLKALENVVLPRLRRALREVGSTIEEDERTESFQRKFWLQRRRGESGAGRDR